MTQDSNPGAHFGQPSALPPNNSAIVVGQQCHGLLLWWVSGVPNCYRGGSVVSRIAIVVGQQCHGLLLWWVSGVPD